MRPKQKANTYSAATVHFPNAFKIAAVLLAALLPVAAACTRDKDLNTKPPHSIRSEPIPIRIDFPPTRTKANASSDELQARRIAVQLKAIEEAELFDNTRSFAILARALTDPEREVKDAALQALVEKDAPEMTPVIRQGLDDSDPEFRMEVLEALAEQGDVESLRRATLDTDEEVRERAAELLESAGH
jgi:hypothetical protein